MQFPTKITLSNHSRLAETNFDDLPFGKNFSDHMFLADYEQGQWGNCEIMPYGNIQMTPANMALHYGQAIFEGMKANIHNKTGEAMIFRPDLHLVRINRSLDRLGMPELPEDLFYQSLHQLLAIDKNWIPTREGASLYLRPVVFATDEFLGVRASDTYKYVLLTGPTNAYYNKPIKLLVADKYVRAFPGGTGFAKCAGNYAATIKPAREAREKGFDQILWVDGMEYSYLQECGTMNIFAVIGDTVITPTATDTILAGITRDSLIALLKHKGYKVEERPVTIQELIEAQKAGELKEMFGTGTAAVVSHVIEFAYKGVNYQLPSADNRPIGTMLKKWLEDIRQGESEDIFNWLVPVQSTVTAH